MNKKSIALAGTAALLIGLGCKHEQMARTAAPAAPVAAAPPAPVLAKDTTGKVIVHIVSRNQTITVKSGEHGVVYSVRDAEGELTLADATPEEFQRVDPVLFNQIQHSMAV